MSLFRQEAIETKRRRLLGDVRLAQPPSFAIWTAVFTVICVAIFCVLILGRYTRKETVRGFIMPAAGIVQIKAAQSGRIARVLVEEGQVVPKGAPLIEFTSDISSIGQRPMLDVQIAEMALQMVALEERQTAIQRGYSGELARLRSQISAQRRLQEILSAQRDVQAQALDLSEQDAARLSSLQSRGFAPNAEVDRRRRVVLSERAALSELDNRLSQVMANIADLQSQSGAIPARQAEVRATIAGESATLAQRQAELQLARGYVIRAPVGGRISGLQARAGATPTPELLLLSIAPSGSSLQAHLLVPTRAAGFLKKGQEARIQVDAYPFQRFGFVEGHIQDIATTVIRPGEAAFPIEQTEPAYLVRVSLGEPYVKAYGERRQLQPGMVLQADIPIDRRRLWQQLFDPLLAAGKRMGS